MNEPPLVTIVTPSLNQGRWIEQAIQSVLDQDYPRIEYLIMEGGSTDATLDVLRRYEGRLTWTSGRDGGQAQAIASGFARTRGEILAWLNADDVYLPGAVRRAVEALGASPEVGLVFGEAEFIDDDGQALGRAAHIGPVDSGQLLRLGDCIVQPSTFFRRSAYDAAGSLDPELYWTMDYDLWLRLASTVPTRHLHAVLSRVRCTPTTKTASGGARRLAEVESVVRRHGGRSLPAWFALETSALQARAALEAMREGQLKRAAGAVGTTLRHLATPATLRALASRQTWRIVRQRWRNAALT